MARDYTIVRVTIWNDPDFITRTTDAQWLYFTLLTHPLIDSCGVVPWREAKLVKTSVGMTVSRLRAAACDLAAVGLIAVDPETEEALVRSFVRHDGVLKSPNMTKALVREHGAITSLTIKALVSREVRRAVREHPEWKGVGAAQPVAKQFADADETAFVMVPEWFRKGSDSVPSGFEIGSDSVPSGIPPKQGNPSDSVPLSLTPNKLLTTRTTSISSEVADATVRPDVEAVLDHLDEQIARNGAKTPGRTKHNIDAARLLIDRDGHTVSQIVAAIDFATNDEFWRTNILSMSKLRQQYDRLRLAAQRQPRSTTRPTPSERAMQTLAIGAALAAADNQPSEIAR